MSPDGKRFGKALAAVLLLAGATAHVLYWYWPRERPGLPLAGSGPAELLAAEGYDAVLWLPHPHQNLATLARAVPELGETVAAASRLSGGRGEKVAAFGPFVAPPSRELAVAFDLAGGRVAAAARVYPLIAVLAKLAGRLAGNPWLSGGEVESGGRKLLVSWQGSLWQVRTVGEATPSQAAGAGSGALAGLGSGPALAVLRLARPHRGLPPGTYALDRQEQGLLLSDRSGWTPPLELRLEASDAAALAFVAEASGPRMGALFDSRLSLIPRLASFYEPGKKRWKLPAESLLELAGDLPHGQVAGWGIVAVDDQAYDRAAALAPQLAVLRDGPLALALWLRPAQARTITVELAKNLGKIPVVGEEPARRFRDMSQVLAALERFARVEVVVGTGDGEVRLELELP